jgi:hypothetical protein
MGYLAKEISDGLSASVDKIIKSVETQIGTSQKLLETLTQSSLITIDATVAAHVGTPLKEAAADIKHFVDVLDKKIVPTLDKLDPVLADMPTLVTEMTKTLKSINEWVGPEEKESDRSWLDDLNPFSDKVTDDISTTANILKEEQGDNSFNVYDAQANKKLDSLKGLRDVWTDDGRSSKWKPGMTKLDKVNAQMEAMRQPTNKAWMDAYKGEGKGGGSAGAHKFGPFDTSGKSPYYPARDFAETRKARDLQKSQVKDLKIKGVHQTIKDLSNKMDIERGTNFGKGKTDIEISKELKQYLTKANAAEEKAKLVKNIQDSLVKSTSAANAASATSQGNFFTKLAEWWNKGRTGTEATRKWTGSGGLWADDASKMAHTTKAFKDGTTSAATLRPWKAFLDMDILKTGPTPAVRQAFERTLGPILKFLRAANPYLLAIETMTISGSTPLSQRSKNPQANIDMLRTQQSNAFTTEAEHLMLQKLIDTQQLILYKMPEVEDANLANRALSGADDGPQNSLGVNLHNPEDINVGGMATQAVSLARDANGVLKEGFKSVVTGGHFDAKATILGLAQRAAGRAMDSLFDGIFGSFFGSANGNILRGGFQAFAKGGLVTKPTLGLVGEGKYNEAVVPLPDGRSIPISGATGNTENNVTVNVTIDSDGNAKSDTNSGMDGDRAKQLGYMVSQAVQAELVDQKRPGGLLSQY